MKTFLIVITGATRTPYIFLEIHHSPSKQCCAVFPRLRFKVHIIISGTKFLFSIVTIHHHIQVLPFSVESQWKK